MFATFCPSFTDNEELRLVMVGMTGVGKSSLGNSIFGADFAPPKSEEGEGGIIKKFMRPFVSKSSSQSVTKTCRPVTTEVLGRRITVVDTPGFFDTKIPYWDTVREVSRCCLYVEPGPHAILLVIKIGRMTEEVIRSIGTMKMVFGSDCINYVCIIFTGADDLMRDESTIEEYIGDLDDKFKALINIECKLRFLAFNNTHKAGSKENKEQVRKFLELIDRTISDNKGKYYTNSMLEKASKIMYKDKEKKEREEKEHKNKLQELQNNEKKLQDEMVQLRKAREEDLQREKEEAKERELRMKEETEKKILEMGSKVSELEKQHILNQEKLQFERQVHESQKAAAAAEEKHRQELEMMMSKMRIVEAEQRNRERAFAEHANRNREVTELQMQLLRKEMAERDRESSCSVM